MTYAPLDRLAEHVGAGAARALASVYGGTRLYVPRTLRPGPLLDLLGALLLARLTYAFGGEAIDVPRLPAVSPDDRAKRVATLSSSGHSASEIALALGCSVRTVRRHREKARAGKKARVTPVTLTGRGTLPASCRQGATGESPHENAGCALPAPPRRVAA